MHEAIVAGDDRLSNPDGLVREQGPERVVPDDRDAAARVDDLGHCIIGCLSRATEQTRKDRSRSPRRDVSPGWNQAYYLGFQ